MPEESWRRSVEIALGELRRRRLSLESVILFGSWARSGGGEWSDIDLLVISDDVKDMPILERFKLIADLKIYRVDLFIYTFEELKHMVYRGNPLAISALIEGVYLASSPRIEELKEKAKKIYTKKGRTWIRSDAI